MSDEERTAQEEPEVGDVATLSQSLAEEREKAENYLANWQRAQADFENYKRRSDQERQESARFANSQLMLGLLPALDDLERALESVTPQPASSGWVEGIRLIARKLQAGMETQGVSQIKALGQAFDPNFHEAAGHGQGEEGIVVQELQKGYMLHDRVLRPSMVIVGNGEETHE